MNTVWSRTKLGEAAIPSRPPSLSEVASVIVATGATVSSPSGCRRGPTLRTRNVRRSVTSAPPSGRKATPHGTSRLPARVVTDTSSSPRDDLSAGPRLKFLGSCSADAVRELLDDGRGAPDACDAGPEVHALSRPSTSMTASTAAARRHGGAAPVPVVAVTRRSSPSGRRYARQEPAGVNTAAGETAHGLPDA